MQTPHCSRESRAQRHLVLVGCEARVKRGACPTGNGPKVHSGHRFAKEVLASGPGEQSRFLQARGEPLQLLHAGNWVGRTELALPFGSLCARGPTEGLSPIL